MINISPLNDKNTIFYMTNEVLSSYGNIYDFDNARVLSVVGSGDQYFTSILNGAKEVELFDINKAAWEYFQLKYMAIKILSYEEFFDFFVLNKYSKSENSINAVNKLLKVIPEGLKNIVYFMIRKFKEAEEYRWTERSINNFKSGYIVPYLTEENYYILQRELHNREIPNFYHSNLTELRKKLEGNYDLMLFSNIFDYLNMSIEEFYGFLQKFNVPVIQANYEWLLYDNRRTEYEQAGFIVTDISNSESVISLTRKNK